MPETLSLFGAQISLYYLFWFFGVVAVLAVGYFTVHYGFSFAKSILYIVLAVAVGYALLWGMSLAVGGGKMVGLNYVRIVTVLPLAVWLVTLIFKDSFGQVADFIAPLLAIFHGVTHIGCIFPGCCHGYPAAWGLYSNEAGAVCFPSQPLETVSSLLTAAVLLFMMKKNVQTGKLYAWYLIMFGGSRFLWEFLRDNEKIWFGISELALHALTAFVVGIIVLIVLTVIDRRGGRMDKNKTVGSMNKLNTKNVLAVVALLGVLLLFGAFLFEGATKFLALCSVAVVISTVVVLALVIYAGKIASKRQRAFLIVIAFSLFITASLAVTVFGAEDLSEDVGVTGLSVSDTGSTNWTANKNKLEWQGTTVITTGCSGSTTVASGALTLANKSGEAKLLSFVYTITLNGGSLTIDGESRTSNGTFSKVLNDNESITISISSSSSEANTTTVVLSSINISGEEITVTFQQPINGSYTVDGIQITDDTIKETLTVNTHALVATPAEGYFFEGWYYGATKVYNSASVPNAIFVESGSLRANFAPLSMYDPLYILAQVPSDSAYPKEELISTNSKYFHNTKETVDPEKSGNSRLSDRTNSYYTTTAASGTKDFRNIHYVPSSVWSDSMTISASGTASGECTSSIADGTYAYAQMVSDVIQIYAKKNCTITFDYTNSMKNGDSSSTENIIYYYISQSSNETVANVIKGTQLTGASGSSGSIAVSEDSYLYILATGYTCKSGRGSPPTLNYSYSASIFNFVVESNEVKHTLTSGFRDFRDNTDVALPSGQLSISGTNYNVGSDGNITDLQIVDLTSLTFKVGKAPSGYKHIGWKVTINGETSEHYATEYSCPMTADCNVIALFAPQMTITMGSNGYDDATYKLSNGNAANGQYVARNATFEKFYTTLAEAFKDTDTVVLLASTTINGDWEIPNGKTLVIPFGLTDQGSTAPVSTKTSTNSEYCKVTLNGKLTVNGTLLVSARQYSSTGSIGDSIGHLTMVEGSSITVNGSLYAYGPVTGSGVITANSSAKIHEYMEIKDPRSAGYLINIYAGQDSKHTFPFNNLFVNNIEVAVTYGVGATLTAHMALMFDEVTEVEIPLIGQSGAMFNFSSGTITKYYDKSAGQFVIQINKNAKATTGPFGLSMKPSFQGFSQQVNINSADYYVPLSAAYRFDVAGELTFSGNYKFLPGATLNVQEGGKVIIASNSNVVFYRMNDYDYRGIHSLSEEQWGFGQSAYPMNPARVSGVTYPFTFNADNVGSAKLNVDGTVTVLGGLYVTDSLILSDGEEKEGITVKGNGYNFLTGKGTIDMSNAKNGLDTIYEAMTASLIYDIEWAAVKVVPMKGLKPDATADEAGQYESLSGVVKGYKVNGLNVWGEDPCANGHTWENGKIVASTCTEEGYTEQICSICGAKQRTDVKAKLEHKYNGVVTAQTCTEKGYTTYTCTYGCGDSYIGDETAALGHTPGATATCMTAQICTVCKVELNAALDHDWGEWTDVDDNTHKHTCKRTGCGESETVEHNYDNGQITTPVTCTTDGVRTYTCSDCDGTKTETIAHEGHTHGAAVEENRTESTCKVAGSYESVVYCTECGDELSRTKVDLALAQHTAGTAVEENRVEASCSAEGSYEEVVYCSVCNAELSRTDKVIEKLAHTAGAAVEENRVESTCTDKGSYDSVVYCSVCNAELSRTKVDLPLAAHTAGEAVTENNVESTCTTSGSYDTVVYCTECEAEMSRVTTTVKENGHTSGTPVIENNVDVTCTEDGSYDTVTYCTVCDAELSRVTTTVTHSGHTAGTPAIENNVDATCTEDGSYDTVTYCTVCDAELSRVNTTVPETGHTAGEAVKENQTAASCDEAGSYDSVVYCSVCNAELSRETKTVDKIGHSYQGVITTHPTCTEAGVKTFTCSVCNDVYTEPIEKLGHTLTQVGAKAPTCEDDGYEAYEYCSVCTYTTYQEVEATGHSHEAVVTAPTCTAEGYTTYTCHCGDSYVSDNQPAKGHTNADAVIENNVDATCSAQGSYDSVVYCSVCNTEISRTNVTVDALEHKWVDANCTTPKTCSVCGATEGAALGHKWTAATCTSPKTCRVCGETEGTALGHTEATLAGKDATCTETGLTEGKYCSVCNAVITAQEVVAALGHKAVTDEAKAPTCTATGLTEGSHCSVCHEVLKAQETVDALGHDYDYANATYTWVVNPVDDVTCTASAKCKRCDVTKTASGEVSSVTTKEPTCTESGDKEYYAQFDESEGWADQCGDKAHIETGILSALGHDWGEIEYKWSDDYTSCTATRTCKRENCDAGSAPATEVATSVKVERKETPATCTKDGKTIYTATFTEEWAEEKETEVTIKAPGHDYKSVVTAPKCGAEGYTTHTCSVCGDSYINNKTPALEHIFVGENGQTNTKEVVPPTCEERGYTVCLCLRVGCDATENRNYVDALGHNYVKVDAVAPTCTETGLTEGSQCNRCQAWEKAQEIVPAFGHKNGDVVIENDVKPTCTEAGRYDNVIYCTVCTQEVSRETITVDALGHKRGEVVVENNVAPTCTTAGSYENVTYCSVCGEELSRGHVTVDALGHTEETIPAVDATCQAKGWTAGTKCSVCGEVLAAPEVTDINPENHTEKEPKWVSKGSETHVQKYECCDTVVEGSEADHVWNGDDVCDICSDGCDHNYISEVIDPTCTEKGYTIHTCSECGDSKKDTFVDSLGHNEKVLGAVEATCTETGLTEGKQCTTCGAVLVAQNEIPAKGHITVIDKAVAPTCTETGLAEGKHCSVCGEVLVAQDVVEALGHTEVIDKGYAATCTETGLTDGKHCLVCGETLVAQEEIPALGHSEVADAAKAPTCTETGLTEGKHCSVCGEVLVAQDVVAALDHIEVVYAEAKEATCTETGLTVGKKCSVCGKVTEAQGIITAKGHSYQEAVTTEPTCGTDGVKTLTCTRCSATSTEAIPATNEHDYNNGTIECDKVHQWKKCATCDETNFKAPRTFRIIFQGGTGGDDIVLPGVYFYGYNETFIVPEFKSNFFAYEYFWEVDGQKLKPGSTVEVSALDSLISENPTDSEWNTIYVTGGYKVSGLDPNAIMMSMQYENNTGAAGDIFLTLSIFVRVEPGMTHDVVQSGGTGLTIKGAQVGNLGLYHYQIPLTAEQMNDSSLKITISYTENGRPVLSKEIGVNLTAYSAALNKMLGDGVTGQASQTLINATMAYGAALQSKVNDDFDSLTAFNPIWRTEAAAVKVLSTIATSPEYSGEATCLTDAAGNQIPIAKITGANVAMSQTYALLYRYEINLPDGIEPTMFCLILTDEDGVIDRDKAWEGKSYEKTEKIPGKADDGTPVEYDAFVIENVPASEMTVRYATMYVEYVDKDGNECYAYSRTVKYGVVTYLNDQIEKMLSKVDLENIEKVSESDLRDLYLWDNLRTVAMYAEKNTKN